jgi:hypothetical protein
MEQLIVHGSNDESIRVAIAAITHSLPLIPLAPGVTGGAYEDEEDPQD